MKRLAVGLTAVFALLLVASVALAVPPGFCDPGSGHEYHPQCQSTTTSTTASTTTTPQPPGPEACKTVMTISGGGSTAFECLWTPAKLVTGADVATVTISDMRGGIKGPPTVFVRDDSPGDICVLEQGWEAGTEYVAEFDLLYGNDLSEGYEAWEGQSYGDFIWEDATTKPVKGAYWCAPQDPIVDSIRLDTNGAALHLNVYFNARGGDGLAISLSPGQEG
jgi:hypothetical protein